MEPLSPYMSNVSLSLHEISMLLLQIQAYRVPTFREESSEPIQEYLLSVSIFFYFPSCSLFKEFHCYKFGYPLEQ